MDRIARNLAVRGLLLALLFPIAGRLGAETWYIQTRVDITAPRDVDDVVVTEGGALYVTGVGEPGFRISGNLVVEKNGRAEFRDSTVKVMSQYHGQYVLAAREQGRLVIDRCRYLVPSLVQHALVSMDDARLDLTDTAFGFVQLVPVGRSRMTAARLTGDFECVLSDSARLELSDIPSRPGEGSLWVWPTFMPGAQAVYSPPLPGNVDHFDFPPAGSTGVAQSFTIDRCAVRLWPMLVREDTRLTLADISPDNWVVVGLYLPASRSISGLMNRTMYDDAVLPLDDRSLRLLRTTIDTWNLYPTLQASVSVENCLIGELLAGEDSRVSMVNTIVDGTGGYLGAQDRARLEATGCIMACDVQASDLSGMTFRRSLLLPYFSDTTGAFTFLRSFDTSFIHLDQSFFQTTPLLGGRGAFAVTAILDAPAGPPAAGRPAELHGYALLVSLDPLVTLKAWSLRLIRAGGLSVTYLGGGDKNVENGYLGTWSEAEAGVRYELRLSLRDSLFRRFDGKVEY